MSFSRGAHASQEGTPKSRVGLEPNQRATCGEFRERCTDASRLGCINARRYFEILSVEIESCPHRMQHWEVHWNVGSADLGNWKIESPPTALCLDTPKCKEPTSGGHVP
eukprot:5089840-Prymnesium_polylepis.1